MEVSVDHVSLYPIPTITVILIAHHLGQAQVAPKLPFLESSLHSDSSIIYHAYYSMGEGLSVPPPLFSVRELQDHEA